MTAQTENKDLVRRAVKGFDAHDFDAISKVIAEDLVNHAAVPEAQGLAGLKRVLEKVFEASPDQRYTLEDMIAEGDRVVCRVTLEGTNTGPLPFANVGVTPTGRRFKTEHIHIFRVANGKIVEHWGARDDIGVFRQLGLPPFGK